MHPPAPPRVSFFNRRELFCQHYAAGAGGAEAVRRAGYSPNGAKQRACFLLRKPEIRLHIEALRAERRGEHQRHLADAIAVVDGIIADAVQASKSSVALRAVEFKLKLHGVIRDKRIDFFSYNDTPSPDADLENADSDPKEDLDGLPGHEYAVAPSKPASPAPTPEAAAPAPAPAPEAVTAEESAPEEIVTNDDPNAETGKVTPAAHPITPPITGRSPVHPRPVFRHAERHAGRDTGMMTLDDLHAGALH